MVKTLKTYGAVEDLRTFLHVVDAGTLSAAAAGERVSVNAISQRLARLERRLGTRLVNRTTRSLHVTEEGARFALHCRQALAALDNGWKELDGRDRGMEGHVVMLLHPALTSSGLVSCVAPLLAEHPGLTVAVRVERILRDTMSMDVALWPDEVSQGSLMVRRLGPLRWGLAAAPSYARRAGLPRVPRDVTQHECLLALRSPRETHWVLQDEAGRRVQVSISGRVESNDGNSLKEAIRAGAGIGLLPLGEIREGARQGTLIHVLPTWAYNPLHVSMYSPAGRMRVPRVKAVADVLARAYKALG